MAFSVKKLLVKILTPENLASARKYLHTVANGADMLEALHGHICNSQCWHFPGYENGFVRCSCRYEEGPSYRFHNGSGHAPECWVHRVYVELGGLEKDVRVSRAMRSPEEEATLPRTERYALWRLELPGERP